MADAADLPGIQSDEIVVSRTVRELRERIEAERAAGRTIGLVPTMGALHAGHDSLVRAALEVCDVGVASIFVNPLQFGPNEDFDRYPRVLDADRERLAALGCRHLWLPSVEVMYPAGFATRLEMTGLPDGLCGAARPGHFSGVMTVVLKLLNQVGPDAAFFGQKDYQQAQVIRRVVRDLDVPVEIIVCPIVRETDGLARSSRNAFLSPEQRRVAPTLRRALLEMDAAFAQGERDVRRLLAVGASMLDAAPGLRRDYLVVCDPDDLSHRTEAVQSGDVVAVAAFLGPTRLIDNLLLGRDPGSA